MRHKAVHRVFLTLVYTLIDFKINMCYNYVESINNQRNPRLYLQNNKKPQN